MQSLQTTELLSFHPALLETGVSVGIAPPKIGTYFPRQQLPGVVHEISASVNNMMPSWYDPTYV